MLLFKPDIVIYTRSRLRSSAGPRQEIYDTNVLFSQSLLEYAVKSLVQLFINIGTCLSPEINYYAYTKYQFSALDIGIVRDT